MAAKPKRITSALGKFSNSTVTGDDTSFKKDNIAEFTVKKKVEGSYLLAKILYIVIFFAVIVGIILVAYFFDAGFLVVVFGSISVLLGWIAWYFTHRYVELYYSYAIENSELIATVIYGEKSDKLLLRIKMSQIDQVAPYEGDYKAEADKLTPDEKISLVSTMSAPDIFFVKYHTEDGKTGLVLLEACEKTLKAFKYYGSQTTVVRKTRY